jgi:hypothetical protein
MAKDDLFKSFKESKHLPRGIFTTAVTLAETALKQNNYRGHFVRDLGDIKTVDLWRDVVGEEFEEKWGLALNKARSKTSSTSTSTSTSTISGTNPTDGSDENVDYRTCTTTLRSILRPEIAQHEDLIEKLLSQSQQDIAGAIDEIQVLIHKAVFAVS